MLPAELIPPIVKTQLLYIRFNDTAAMKRLCNFYRCSFITNFLLSFIFAIIVSILLYYIIKLNLDYNASYYTLSSIFQGLFSILALAGFFIIFKVEQLSRDNAKYDNDIEKFLNTLRELSSKLGSIFEKEEVMQLEVFNNIRTHIDTRKGIDKEVEGLNKNITRLEFVINGGFKKEGFTKDEILTLISDFKYNMSRIEQKYKLIIVNELEFKPKLVECFKLPFIKGMLLIILAIYFLPLLQSESNLFFHIPLTIIIETSVILTITVVLEIICLIYYSMWSKMAKSTL